jgi:hypothetical protein
MHNYKKESGRTTKRRKSEKLNHFFKRDLKEIIRALNSKNEFFTLDTTGNSEEFIRIRIYRGPNYILFTLD